MKRLALATIILGLLALTPTANAATRCGSFTNDGEWYVTAIKTPCPQARAVATTYIHRQVKFNWIFGRLYLHPWRCVKGATSPGICSHRQGGRAGIIIKNYRDPDAESFWILPPTLYSEELDARRAIAEKFEESWQYGHSRSVKCREASRLISTCSVKWGIGDLGFGATVRVRLWPTVGKWGMVTARGVARRVDWYCYGVLNKSARACTTWFEVGPRRFPQ